MTNSPEKTKESIREMNNVDLIIKELAQKSIELTTLDKKYNVFPVNRSRI